MNNPSRGSLRRTATWTAPIVAAAAFIAAGPISGLLTGPANADLPARSAAQLLVDVQKANLDGFSGTVVENASLGLPALPDGLTSGSTGTLGMLTGTHTMRVWFAGPEQARISLLSPYAETDLIRNGTNLWQWSSSGHSAQHWTLPAHSSAPATAAGPATPAGPAQTKMPATPQQAADEALSALSPTTLVTGDGTTTVANRPAYVLALQPRSATTLIGSVRIAIDGKTHVPTQVQVFAKGASTPAISVGFSSFDPGAPQSSVFAFNPPAGTTVTQGKPPASPNKDGRVTSGASGTSGRTHGARMVGSGWNTVVVANLPADNSSTSGAPSQLTQLMQQFPRVSGTWGSGYLFGGTLVSVVVTDDHRVAAGMVPPAQLYAALQAR